MQSMEDLTQATVGKDEGEHSIFSIFNKFCSQEKTDPRRIQCEGTFETCTKNVREHAHRADVQFRSQRLDSTIRPRG